MTRTGRQADGCAYCGLPLAASWYRSEHAETARPAYCCIGCRIAASVTDASGAEGHIRWMMARLGISIFFSMNVMVFSMALWSQDLYGVSPGEESALAGVLWQLFRYLGLLFSLPVLFLLGGPIVDNVAQSVRRGVITTDVLILLGVLAAYLYSAVSVFRGVGHVYFEIACIVLVMVTLGRWLEATGKHRASEIMDGLADLLPDKVRILRDDSIQMVPRDELVVGDCLSVLPGERFAVDGRILVGVAEVDEQILTGESMPVVKQPGDPVYSGTLNAQGDLQVEVTAAAGNETVSRMIDMIRRARLGTGRYARLADRVATWFVPVVLIIALAAGAYHTLVTGVDTGILASLAVVLIACPCALGIATPMAVWCALGHAARRQVLLHSGSALEQ